MILMYFTNSLISISFLVGIVVSYSQFTPEEVIVIKDSNDVTISLRKCCPVNQSLDETTKQCSLPIVPIVPDEEASQNLTETENYNSSSATKAQQLPPNCHPHPVVNLRTYCNLKSPCPFIRGISPELLLIAEEDSFHPSGNENASHYSHSHKILHHGQICADRSTPTNSSINPNAPDEDEEGILILSHCAPPCSPSSPCLRKCCGPFELISNDSFSCTPLPIPPMSTKTIEGQDQRARVTALGARATHTGLPVCGELGNFELPFYDPQKPHRSVQLLGNGKLRVQHLSSLELELESDYEVSWDQFCVDEIQSSDDVVDDTIDHRIALICFPEVIDPDAVDRYEDPLHEYRSSLYPTLTGISSLFLLLTSIIYGILWKDLNLPGWLQFSYTNSLCLAFTLLTLVQLFTTQIYNYSQGLCKIIGYTLHLSFLSCFFWLTSMNIDLWCSFRNTSVMTGFGRNRGRRRYICFAIVSIFVPLAVTGILIMEDLRRANINEPRNIDIDDTLPDEIPLITSEIGGNRCALDIHSKMAQLVYFYAVVGLLLVVNLMFFFCTVLCLRERHRETKFAHRQCTAPDSADLIRFRLFTRLFFIMGVLWIFELLSWLTNFFQLNSNLQSIFVVTDALNALQGVAIFLMFVWKPQTWRQLRKKFRRILSLDSQASLVGVNTIKSSLKSSITKSSGGGSLKTNTLNPI